jgi:threonine synthase
LKYFSTRGEGAAKRSAEAIIQGLATDKGLYVPDSIPTLDIELGKLSELSYQDIARTVIGKFFDDFSAEEVDICVNGAYDSKFSDPKIAPLVKVKDAYVLELYHGRTSAFKDMALSILPYLLTTSLKKEKEEKEIVILTATSGDTGKAALEGFADVPGTQIIVFYPTGGVSEIQEKQMITQEGANTHVYSIVGNFDDAQTGVKNIFNDDAFAAELDADGYKLSSANSINIGRLVPQVAYYISAYAQLIQAGEIQPGDAINVCVPTGNFGNLLAAYYAKNMGIPIKKFICASNENNVLTDLINDGVYDANRDFFQTSSPSMDILISSNVERLLYHLSGDNADEIASYMKSLDDERRYRVSDKVKEGLSNFIGYYSDMNQTHDAIKRLYNEEHYLMDTHTAVAWASYESYVAETGDNTPTVVASTASPYKFAGDVAKSIGVTITEDGFANMDALYAKTGVAIPEGLAGLEHKKVLHDETIEKEAMPAAVKKSLNI